MNQYTQWRIDKCASKGCSGSNRFCNLKQGLAAASNLAKSATQRPIASQTVSNAQILLDRKVVRPTRGYAWYGAQRAHSESLRNEVYYRSMGGELERNIDQDKQVSIVWCIAYENV